ncbi:MAG: TfoX/Sxy family protein [Xanthomonadales bacterium]|nr:TfoX/Sxy family protein [Xanthomonadales bacterium]MCB1633653.1 TfoX/Sxy family protein [Xanthomonadales bacterium]
MTASEKIRNVGPRSAAWLRQVGVRNTEELKAMGSVEVFRRIVKAGFKPSLNLLYAMAGAEDDCHWTALDEDRKAALILAAEQINTEAKVRRKAHALGRDPDEMVAQHREALAQAAAEATGD